MIPIDYPLRFLIAHLAIEREGIAEIKKELEETFSLIHALKNVEIVDMILQRDSQPHKATYIGSGKAKQIAERIKNENIQVVVINALVKPRQIFELKKIFWEANPAIEVWDRIDLILHIFSFHAHTAEAKLQIELAKMAHMGPRIYGMGSVLSQQGGGIGTSGIGETNVELMKRHWRDQMQKVTGELKKLSDGKEKQLESRKKLGLKTVSLVGYTNAGKSTLFNALTGKKTLVENALFATLDSHVGKIYLPEIQKEIMVTDTIGFIRKLPATLIDAFQSTLLESIHADILLHVIDASDDEMEKKIAIVRDILKDLNVGRREQIFVFNKIDKANGIDKETLQERFASFHPIFISANNPDCLPEVQKMLANVIKDTS